VRNKPTTPYRRSISTAGLILVFLGVALYGFTQTATFRTYLRTQILDLLTTEIRGNLVFGEITGNLLTGFSIDSLRVQLDGQMVLQADRLEARYNPLVLLFDVPRFRRTTLVRPQIHLWRSSTGAWNIQGLLPESPADTAALKWYTVKRGDTLTTIAKKLRVNRVDLADANYLSARSLVTPGQNLVIPVEPSRLLARGPESASPAAASRASTS